jgi:hypothetical protein
MNASVDIKKIPFDIENMSKEEVRDKILELEKSVGEMEGAFFGDSDICPLKHSFADGMYVREIFLPKGVLVVGKIHKHEHPNFILKGEVTVFTESGGCERIKAPCSMISPAGTKRAVFAKEDTVWVTIHNNPTNTQDLKELEDLIIAKNYSEYEKFISENKKQLIAV